MIYSRELCSLVINNIEIVEEAPVVAREIDSVILTEINNRIKNYISRENNWSGEFELDPDEKGETAFYASEWLTDDGTLLASFELCGIGICTHWLTHVVGKRSCQLAFLFSINRDYYDMNLKQAQSLYRSIYDDNPSLGMDGFVVINGDDVHKSFIGLIGIKFNLSLDLVAKEYPNDFDECFKPLDDTLDKIMRAKNIFLKATKDRLAAVTPSTMS